MGKPTSIGMISPYLVSAAIALPQRDSSSQIRSWCNAGNELLCMYGPTAAVVSCHRR
jgi:hypothetical protein